MHNEFSAIIEQDGEWHIAYCPEIPGANGQGRTKEEARASLAEAIALILEDRREDALRGAPLSVTTMTATRPKARELRQAWHVLEKLSERRHRVRVWEALQEVRSA